jgi:hypothetical protein
VLFSESVVKTRARERDLSRFWKVEMESMSSEYFEKDLSGGPMLAPVAVE